MAVSAPDLQSYVQAMPSDAAYVAKCLAEALALVTSRIPDGITVPDAIVDRAVLEVGSELYHRRNAPSGVTQFAGSDGNPIRVARDPMVAAWPLIAPYIGPVIA